MSLMPIILFCVEMNILSGRFIFQDDDDDDDDKLQHDNSYRETNTMRTRSSSSNILVHFVKTMTTTNYSTTTHIAKRYDMIRTLPNKTSNLLESVYAVAKKKCIQTTTLQITFVCGGGRLGMFVVVSFCMHNTYLPW